MARGKQTDAGVSNRGKGKGSDVKNSCSYVQILGLGGDTGDTNPCVLLFFDQRRYLFNVGEGLQRFCVEYRTRLKMIHHVFLTRVTSVTAGGLPGMILTMADMPDTHSASKPMSLFGPPKLQTFINAVGCFVNVGSVGLRVHEFGATADAAAVAPPGTLSPTCGVATAAATTAQSPSPASPSSSRLHHVHSDELVTVTAVLLTPEGGTLEGTALALGGPDAHSTDATSSSPSLPSSPLGHGDGSGPKHKRVKHNSADTGGGNGTAGIGSLDATLTVTAAAVGADKPPAAEPVSVAYICRLGDIPGKFLPEKAKALNIPSGPIYGRLCRGESVTLPDGRTIHPLDVMEPSTPGPIVLIVDCPSLAYVTSLTTSAPLNDLIASSTRRGKAPMSSTLDDASEASSSASMKDASAASNADIFRTSSHALTRAGHDLSINKSAKVPSNVSSNLPTDDGSAGAPANIMCVVHLAPADVLASPAYREWMGRFAPGVRHLAALAGTFGSRTVNLASASLSAKLNLVHPQVFPLHMPPVGLENPLPAIDDAPQAAAPALSPQDTAAATAPPLPPSSRAAPPPQAPVLVSGTVAGENLLRFHLRPLSAQGLDRTLVPPPLDVAAVQVGVLGKLPAVAQAMQEMEERIRAGPAAQAERERAHLAAVAVADDEKTGQLGGKVEEGKRKEAGQGCAGRLEGESMQEGWAAEGSMRGGVETMEEDTYEKEVWGEGAGEAVAMPGIDQVLEEGRANGVSFEKEDSDAGAIAGASQQQLRAVTTASRVVPLAVGPDARDTLELLFLGTGAAIPSKYRNVTSMYVHMFDRGGFLCDAGEGTYGQLLRRYGMQGVQDVLRDLRLVWISHIHADHHAGLPHVLALRRQLLGPSCPPIPVVGPRPLRRVLDSFRNVEDLAMLFIDCAETTNAKVGPPQLIQRQPTTFPGGSRGARDTWQRHASPTLAKQRTLVPRPPLTEPGGMALLSSSLKALGIDRMESVEVIHCAQAFGLILEGRLRGSVPPGKGQGGSAPSQGGQVGGDATLHPGLGVVGAEDGEGNGHGSGDDGAPLGCIPAGHTRAPFRCASDPTQNASYASGTVGTTGGLVADAGGNKRWKIALSGDTRPCPKLVERSRGATVLIHEATFENDMPDEAVAKNHSMTKEAIESGIAAGAWRTILTHFSQRYPKIPVIDEHYTAHTGIAFDLMTVNLGDLWLLPELLPPLQLMFAEEQEAGEAAQGALGEEDADT